MRALLQFNQFKVLEMIYRSSLVSQFAEELSPTFGVQVGLNESDSREAIVKLTCEIGEEQDNDYLKVVIAGFFTFDSESDASDDVIYKYFEINGTAILFPYLRSIVSDLTSKGQDSPIILPTINIPALLQKQDEEESD